jgi:hypothetical protein
MSPEHALIIVEEGVSWGLTTPISVTRKPLNVLAEGLVSENSRGDWTPLELFLAGVRGWEAVVRRRIGVFNPRLFCG